MKKFHLHLILYIAFFTHVLGNKIEKLFLNDGRGIDKLLQLQEQRNNLASAIRNLTIANLSSRCQLVEIGNDLIWGVQSGNYAVNQALVTVEDVKDLHDRAAKVIDVASDLITNLQHNLHGSPENLKEAIAATVEGLVKLAGTAVDYIKDHLDISDKYFYISNQIRKGTYLCAYAMRKLRYQTQFFNLTNKELEVHLDAGYRLFATATRTIQSENNNIIQDELVHWIENLERRVEKAVAELESWLHINKDPESSKIVMKVVHDLIENYNRINPRVASTRAVLYTKNHFETVYGVLVKQFKKLCAVKIPQDSGCGVVGYLRSSIIGSITLSNLYSEEIKYITTLLAAPK